LKTANFGPWKSLKSPWILWFEYAVNPVYNSPLLGLWRRLQRHCQLAQHCICTLSSLTIGSTPNKSLRLPHLSRYLVSVCVSVNLPYTQLLYISYYFGEVVTAELIVQFISVKCFKLPFGFTCCICCHTCSYKLPVCVQ